jgi:hypothetical protein
MYTFVQLAEVFVAGPGTIFSALHFILMNRPNKLECNIKLSSKGLPGTNNLPYCRKKMKGREYDSWAQCYKTFFVRNLRIFEIS